MFGVDFLNKFFKTGDVSTSDTKTSSPTPTLDSSAPGSTSATPNTDPTSDSSNKKPPSDNDRETSSTPTSAKISAPPSSTPSKLPPTIDLKKEVDLLTLYSMPVPNYNPAYAKEALEISEKLPKRDYVTNYVIPRAILSENEKKRLKQTIPSIPHHLISQQLTVLTGNPFVVLVDNVDSKLNSLQKQCHEVFSAVSSEVSQRAKNYKTTDPHNLLDLHKGIPIHPAAVIFPCTENSEAVGLDNRPLLKSEVHLYLEKTTEEYVMEASIDKDGTVASIFYLNGTPTTDMPIIKKALNAQPRAHEPIEIDIGTGLKLRTQGMDTLADQVKNHGALHCVVRLKPPAQPKPVPVKNKRKKEKVKVERPKVYQFCAKGGGFVAPSVDAVVGTGKPIDVTYKPDQGEPLEITDVRFYYVTFVPINPNRGMFLENPAPPGKMEQSARRFTTEERVSYTQQFANMKLEVIKDYIRSSYPLESTEEIIKNVREFLIKKSIDEQYTETILSLAILTYIGSKISDFTMVSIDKDLINLNIKFTLSAGKIAFVNKLVRDFNEIFNTTDCHFSSDEKSCFTISFPGKLISSEVLEKILNSFLTTQISQGTQNYMQRGKLNIIDSPLEKLNGVLEFNDIDPICIGTVLLKLANCSEKTIDIYPPRPGIFETYFCWKISKDSATQVIKYLNTFAGETVATFIRKVDTANTQFCEIAIQNFFFQLPQVVNAIEDVCDRSFFLDPELCRYRPLITEELVSQDVNALLKPHSVDSNTIDATEHSILHAAGININLITHCKYTGKGSSLEISVEHMGKESYANTIQEKLNDFYGKCTFSLTTNQIVVKIPFDQLALKWGDVKASSKHLLSYPENVALYKKGDNPTKGLNIPASNYSKITEKIKSQTQERKLENNESIFPHAALHAAGIDISIFKKCEFRDRENEDVIIIGKFTNHLDPEKYSSILQNLKAFYNCQFDYTSGTETLSIIIPYTTCFSKWDDITTSVEYLLSYPENKECYQSGNPPTQGLTRFFSREGILSDVVSLSATWNEMKKKIIMVIDENIKLETADIVEHAIMHAAGIDIKNIFGCSNSHKASSLELTIRNEGNNKLIFDKLKLFYGDGCKNISRNANVLTIEISYSTLALKFSDIMNSIRHLVSYPENVTAYKMNENPTAGLTIFPSGVLHISQLTDTEIDEIDSSADLSLSPQVAATSSAGWKPGFSYGGETPKQEEIINPDYQASSARVQL